MASIIHDRGVVAGNVTDKYRSRNPVARALMDRFLRTVGELYLRDPAERVLEIGCGPGDLAGHLCTLRRPARFVGVDLSPLILDEARRAHGDVCFAAQSASALGFADRSFDLVVACEVLEHLPDPEAGLREIARVARGPVILSVPREPLWRVLNVVRGAYWRELGNTPGHLQHWSQPAFVEFVARRLFVREVHTPLPWTIIGAEVRA